VGIGEPDRESFAPGEMPGSTAATGHVAQLSRDSQCDEYHHGLVVAGVATVTNGTPERRSVCRGVRLCPTFADRRMSARGPDCVKTCFLERC
jgi:hypothetical protein